MTLPKLHIDDKALALSWEALGHGAPTILGLAKLCSDSLASNRKIDSGFSGEARTILFAARQRGVIAVNGSNKAFDSVDRFLSIHVEVDEDTVLAFKSKREPKLTVRYLDAFRELCAGGLVHHHLFREFSLTTFGFEVAAQIEENDVQQFLSQAVELGRHEW